MKDLFQLNLLCLNMNVFYLVKSSNIELMSLIFKCCLIQKITKDMNVCLQTKAIHVYSRNFYKLKPHMFIQQMFTN